MGAGRADAHARAAADGGGAAAGGDRGSAGDARGDHRGHDRGHARVSGRAFHRSGHRHGERDAGVRVAELAGDREPVRAGVQPDSGLSARRRPDRAGADLVADGRSQPRDTLDRARRPGLRAGARRVWTDRIRLRRQLGAVRAGAGVLPVPSGERGGGAGPVRAAHSGSHRGGRDGSRARHDPGGAEPARRAGAVLPALPLAVVRGGRPGPAISGSGARAAS